MTHVLIDLATDVDVFRRTAFWLSRAAVEPGSLRVIAHAEPETADAVVNVLRYYSASYAWDVVVHGQPAEGDSPATIPVGDIQVILDPGTILPPDCLPTVLAELEADPERVVVVYGVPLSPQTMIKLDLYGSNFDARWEGTATRTWNAVLKAHKPRLGGSGPEVESKAVAYRQRKPEPHTPGREVGVQKIVSSGDFLAR